MSPTYYITSEKKAALEEELKTLPAIMIEIAKRIDEARQLGDLSENAEYHAAREELGIVQGRKREIEEVLKFAEIIQESHSGTAQIGSTIVVKVRGKEKTYTIVGAQEADPLEGKISNESPMGEAFLGKKKGDTVHVEAPAGTVEYKIKDIS